MPHYDYCSSQLNQHRLISNLNKSILRFLKINLYGLITDEQYNTIKLKLNFFYKISKYSGSNFLYLLFYILLLMLLNIYILKTIKY